MDWCQLSQPCADDVVMLLESKRLWDCERMPCRALDEQTKRPTIDLQCTAAQGANFGQRLAGMTRHRIAIGILQPLNMQVVRDDSAQVQILILSPSRV